MLVVDDEPFIRQLLLHVLRTEGYKVLEAETGARALDLLRAHDVSLVLLDLFLPDRRGDSLIPEIRLHSPGARIIVMSGMTQEVDDSVLEIDAVLVKPFSFEEFCALVRNVFAIQTIAVAG